MSESILFSQRRIRDYLEDGKRFWDIVEGLDMTQHHVLTSLLKLYKAGEIDWYNNTSGIPTFFKTNSSKQTEYTCHHCGHTDDRDRFIVKPELAVNTNTASGELVCPICRARQRCFDPTSIIKHKKRLTA